MSSYKRFFVAVIMAASLTLIGCSRGISPEEKQQVDALQAQLSEIKQDVAAAAQEEKLYSGGLVKALVTIRLEILKTNDALVQQRILAIQSNAPITVQIPASIPDAALAQSLEGAMAEQKKTLSAAQAEAAKYSGGLVQALALSTVATQGQTLTMMQQRYLIAKFGLALPKFEPAAATADTASPPVATTSKPPTIAPPVQDQVIQVTLESKKLTKQDYQDYLFFNMSFQAIGLDKAARAIKGTMHFNDLFGETKLSVNWSIDKPLNPGESIESIGTGFKYNQFLDSNQWVNATSIDNMKASYTVQSILYQDGTRKDL